jgi:hypothetical protein
MSGEQGEPVQPLQRRCLDYLEVGTASLPCGID